MESLSLPANHNTQTKPRSVGGNTTTNLKSFRSVVLGKDGVGKSGILRFERQICHVLTLEPSMFVYV